MKLFKTPSDIANGHLWAPRSTRGFWHPGSTRDFWDPWSSRGFWDPRSSRSFRRPRSSRGFWHVLPKLLWPMVLPRLLAAMVLPRLFGPMVLPRLMGSLVFPMLSAPRFTLPRHLGTHGPPEAFFFEALFGPVRSSVLAHFRSSVGPVRPVLSHPKPEFGSLEAGGSIEIV